jgi:hypothetical protein
MNFSADKFFKKYTKNEGKSLAWIAHKLGYSPTYVRKVSCHMIPVTAGFVGRAVTILNEDPAIFAPQLPSFSASAKSAQ